MTMQELSGSDARGREALSALLDGGASAADVDAACAAWRDDARARAGWHAYALIGDVLRSEELATRDGHDEEFLRSLRARLGTEPVPLSPALAARPHLGAPSRWGRLAAPAAVAAGVFVVAGAALVLRSAPDTGPLVALGGAGADQTPNAVAVAVAADHRIDGYFEAHRRQSILRASLFEGASERPVEATVLESR